MKLTHIAQALTLALLAVTAWLAYQATEEARMANEKMDRLTGRVTAAAADAAIAASQSAGSMLPAPAPPPAPDQAVPPSQPAPAAPPAATAATPSAPQTAPEPTAAALARAGNPQAAASAPAGSAPAPAAAQLTPLQKRVLDAPSLGKITDVVPQHGFVAFKVPEGSGLKTGMKFDLRRNSAVVGRITVAAIEPDAVVADLDPKSVPAGVSVQVGDEVISIIMTN